MLSRIGNRVHPYLGPSERWNGSVTSFSSLTRCSRMSISRDIGRKLSLQRQTLWQSPAYVSQEEHWIFWFFGHFTSLLCHINSKERSKNAEFAYDQNWMGFGRIWTCSGLSAVRISKDFQIVRRLSEYIGDYNSCQNDKRKENRYAIRIA